MHTICRPEYRRFLPVQLLNHMYRVRCSVQFFPHKRREALYCGSKVQYACYSTAMLLRKYSNIHLFSEYASPLRQDCQVLLKKEFSRSLLKSCHIGINSLILQVPLHHIRDNFVRHRQKEAKRHDTFH